jgi:hypothetical protein
MRRGTDVALLRPIGRVRANYGHFNGFEALVCTSDETAIDKAKRLVNKYGIEIWSGARLVMCLSPSGTK